MDALIGSSVVFCVLAIVGLLIIFFIISFFLPSFRGGPRSPMFRTGRFFNRPPGGSAGGSVGSRPAGGGHGSVGTHRPSGGGGAKGVRGGKR